MDIIQAIRERKSIRGFKPDPVPAKVLEELLDVCRWAPSFQNTQSWTLYVLGGKVMEELKARLTEKVKAKVPVTSDLPTPELTDCYLQRSIAERDSVDTHQFPPGTPDLDAKRAEFWIKGGRWHNAPNGIVICTERALFPKAIFDMGTMTMTIALAAPAFGLGTCIMSRAVYYPEILRELVGIPQSKVIITGISIGYPDPKAIINTHPRNRVPLDAFAHWFGFKEKKGKRAEEI